mmetsp:Transcript_5818/g.15773  ORF Transcript_5818/g.15773 Transcript_5818/m.15773 type:complete len:96 (-) Transcript_5818:38-325(-)
MACDEHEYSATVSGEKSMVQQDRDGLMMSIDDGEIHLCALWKRICPEYEYQTRHRSDATGRMKQQNHRTILRACSYRFYSISITLHILALLGCRL